MTSRTRPPPVQPQQAHQAKLQLLRSLTTAYLAASPSTALFYAERLHALDPISESSAYLLASAFSAQKEHLEAIWVLRQAVTFVPAAGETGGSGGGDDLFGTGPGGQGGAARRWASTSAGKLTRPAMESSVRCARLYSDCCAAVGRAKEGREALARVLQTGVPLAPVEPASSSSDASFTSDLLPPPSFAASLDDPTALTLSLARLAYSSNDADRAIVSFRRVLAKAPTCWEAIETLCDLGAAPDVDAFLRLPPKRAALAATVPQQQQQSQQQQQQALKPLSNSNASSTGSNGLSYPPPLGPSQTAAVNTAWAQLQNGFQSSGGLFTPTEAAPNGVKPNGGGGGGGGGGMLFGGGQNGVPKGKGKEVIGLFGVPGGGAVLPPGFRRTGSGRYVNGVGGGGPEMSMLGDLTGDESSFDTSFYPSAVQPLSFGSTVASHRNGGSAPISTSLFTPPIPATLPTATAPGVKRTRAGNIAPASTAAANGMAGEEDALSTRPTAGVRRPVRGVPEGKTRSTSNGSTAPGAPTRRSSRLSQNAASSGMAPSRSQSSNGGGRGITANGGGGARDKKRSKAGAGPSVLSDSTSTIGSTDGRAVSPSSSSPSSPGGTYPPAISSILPPPTSTTQPDPSTLAARQEAEDYVVSLLRNFAKAEASLSRFEKRGVVEALSGLGAEQARTARAVRMLGRASFEAGEYEKAEKAFQTARQVAPASLQAMDLLSTTLWHLRSPTALSYLAQDLHSLTSSSSTSFFSSSTSAQHPTPWLASGNAFSHLEDHSSALRCFKRAAQVDENCVYAYVLAGHECVLLEEWEKALGFFREAVRRDKGGRGYGAWFGLGNVYLKTGKYTLAEYHFRRALEINPGNVTLICCVGTVLEKLQRYREALEMYERAVQLQPESPLARFKRVRMMLTLRQYQLAESDLLTLKHLAPSEPNVHYLLGRLYKQLGPSRRAEMLQAFARAQDLEPRMASVIREQIERAPEQGNAMDGMDVDDSSSVL
ncbi:hypothetical protein JCM11251_004317 [Rhodosporidiobolus azoricus]